MEKRGILRSLFFIIKESIKFIKILLEAISLLTDC